MLRYHTPTTVTTLSGLHDPEPSRMDNVVNGIKSVVSVESIKRLFGAGSIHTQVKGLGPALQALVEVYRRGAMSANTMVRVVLEFSNTGQQRNSGGKRDGIKKSLVLQGADVSRASGRVHWDIDVPISSLENICQATGSCWQYVHGIKLHDKAREEINQAIAAYPNIAPVVLPAGELDLGVPLTIGSGPTMGTAGFTSKLAIGGLLIAAVMAVKGIKPFSKIKG